MLRLEGGHLGADVGSSRALGADGGLEVGELGVGTDLVQDRLKKGTRLDVLATGAWVHVDAGKQGKGWLKNNVLSQHCRVDEQGASPTPGPADVDAGPPLEAPSKPARPTSSVDSSNRSLPRSKVH